MVTFSAGEGGAYKQWEKPLDPLGLEVHGSILEEVLNFFYPIERLDEDKRLHDRSRIMLQVRIHNMGPVSFCQLYF